MKDLQDGMAREAGGDISARHQMVANVKGRSSLSDQALEATRGRAQVRRGSIEFARDEIAALAMMARCEQGRIPLISETFSKPLSIK